MQYLVLYSIITLIALMYITMRRIRPELDSTDTLLRIVLYELIACLIVWFAWYAL